MLHHMNSTPRGYGILANHSTVYTSSPVITSVCTIYTHPPLYTVLLFARIDHQECAIVRYSVIQACMKALLTETALNQYKH